MAPRPAGDASSVRGPVLGLDLGDVRIGVAISDPDRRVAVPVGTVHVGRPPGELMAVAALAGERGATLVVVGHPVSMSGGPGGRARHAESFAQALRALIEVPVELQDERLSTVEADRALAAAGGGPAPPPAAASSTPPPRP